MRAFIIGSPQSEATKGGDLRSCCGGGGKGFRLVFMLGFRIIESIFEGDSACLSDTMDGREC